VLTAVVENIVLVLYECCCQRVHAFVCMSGVCVCVCADVYGIGHVWYSL